MTERSGEEALEGALTVHTRVLGAVMGAAIGDAMGFPTEFLSASEIRRRYGPNGVHGFTFRWNRDDRWFAPYTDDTQMAEIVLRCLYRAVAEERTLDETMRSIAEGFVAWAREPQGGHRAPGNACLAGARALEAGAHWSEAGAADAGGCGSVMRAYPFGLVFAKDPVEAERWAVEHSRLTHGDPIALAACAAMAAGIACTVQGVALDAVIRKMVASAARHSPATGAMIADAAGAAAESEPPEIILDRLRGWAAHEAIAAAVYIHVRHPESPRKAILEGANAPGDSDSIATLAGALTGARTGFHAIPREWVNDVERSDELRTLAHAVARMVERSFAPRGGQ